MIASRLRAALASRRSGIGAHRVQEGLDHETDTGGQTGRQSNTQESADNDEHNG